MSFQGHVENGTVVFDTPVPPFPDGTPVNVEAVITGDQKETREETADDWIAKLQAIAAAQPICDWHVDDSRESICEGRGE